LLVPNTFFRILPNIVFFRKYKRKKQRAILLSSKPFRR
jgi:hypothetical protein